MGFSCRKITPTMMIVAVLLNAGCSTVSPSQDLAMPTTASVRPYYHTIDLAGRLSIRYEENGKEQAVHGSFVWSQTPEQTTVILLSPLGQTLATIRIEPNQSSLQQAGQPLRTALDVDLLIAQALGWPLPLAEMRGWLQGFGTGSNGKPFHLYPPRESRETVSITTADHWQIQYTNWQTSGDDMQVNYPKRIDLHRYTQQVGSVAIRIVIDQWQPH